MLATHTYTHTLKKPPTPVWGSFSPLCLHTLGSMTVICSKRLYRDWLGEAEASCRDLSWQRKEVCVCLCVRVRECLCLSVCGGQAEGGRGNCLSDCVTECTFWPCVSALTSNGEASNAGTRTTQTGRSQDGNRQTDKKSKHEAKNTRGDGEFVCKRAKDRREQTLASVSLHHCPVWQASTGLALCDCVVLKSYNIISSNFSNYVQQSPLTKSFLA